MDGAGSGASYRMSVRIYHNSATDGTFPIVY
jgi:hypothetical protein